MQDTFGAQGFTFEISGGVYKEPYTKICSRLLVNSRPKKRFILTFCHRENLSPGKPSGALSLLKVI